MRGAGVQGAGCGVRGAGCRHKEELVNIWDFGSYLYVR